VSENVVIPRSNTYTVVSERGVTKNLLSISALEKKGFRVAFIDGEVLMWAKGETMKEAIVIGKEEGGLYKLKGHSEAAMTHAIANPCEL
jgi:hypothetical protein